VVPLQETGEPQVVDAGFCSQAPAPSQKPVLPQTFDVGAQPPCRSVVPAPTLAHVPAALLQAWQREQEPVLQQVPSMQLPLAHSFGPPQVAPFAFLGVQLPAVVALPVQ
jgi:hypothetical protein